MKTKITVAELRLLVADLVAEREAWSRPLPASLRARVDAAMPKKGGRPKGGRGQLAAIVSIALEHIAGMSAGEANARASEVANVVARHVQGSVQKAINKAGPVTPQRLVLDVIDACDAIEGGDPLDGLETLDMAGLTNDQVNTVVALREVKRQWSEVLEDAPDPDSAMPEGRSAENAGDE